MTYNKFKDNIKKAGLSLDEFSSLIKTSHRSISNYSATGKIPKHLAIISTLMHEMAKNDIDFTCLLESLEIDNFQKRGRNQFKNMTK
ncbi:MAG: hypothetical protein WC665_11665 [Sulfurimonas sp.]|jgi:hypothetical protein